MRRAACRVAASVAAYPPPARPPARARESGCSVTASDLISSHLISSHLVSCFSQEFLRSEYSQENIRFWLVCEHFKSVADPEEVSISFIHYPLPFALSVSHFSYTYAFPYMCSSSYCTSYCTVYRRVEIISRRFLTPVASKPHVTAVLVLVSLTSHRSICFTSFSRECGGTVQIRRHGPPDNCSTSASNEFEYYLMNSCSALLTRANELTSSRILLALPPSPLAVLTHSLTHTLSLSLSCATNQRVLCPREIKHNFG